MNVTTVVCVVIVSKYIMEEFIMQCGMKYALCLAVMFKAPIGFSAYNQHSSLQHTYCHMTMFII